MTPFANYLRLWDYASAARVDEFVANSENVRRRIWKTYRRESHVVISAGGGGDVLLDAARRLLSDRLRTGAVQALGRRGARVRTQWAQAAR